MGNKAIQATIGGETIENKKINLLDKFFEIPAYQRLYEWESTQIEELLNDMKKACDDKKEQYFIGNITTSIKNSKGEYDKTNGKQDKIYVLIDGQQRLTTLWFIGFYLASKGCGEWKTFITQGDKLRITMPIRDKEKEALENLAKKIQKSNSQEKLEFSKDLQGIHQKIIDAFKCIESWFVGENGKDIDLAKFADFIYNSVCFVFVGLAENTDLNRFFVRMNNRGKQLEKHEILKARLLSVIQQGGGEWQKYAKIWDLCSDMNKYIFQSANDRKIFSDSKAKNDKKDNNKDETEMTEQKNDKLVHLTEIVEKYTIIKDNKKVKDSGVHSGAESIIDFPTFLLHCYKLYSKDDNISIAKDKLLDIMWKKEKTENINKINFKNNSKYCEGFIKYMVYYRVLFDYFVIKNTLSDDGFAIIRFYKNNNTYQPKANSLKNLAMIQNYLRVARQGDRQNYHHWLTPFLAYLDNEKISTKIWRIVECNFVEIDKIVEFFKADVADKEYDESNVVKFLENLDTKLAIVQLSKQDNKDEKNENSKMLTIANEVLQNLDSVKSFKVNEEFRENDKWGFLKYGNDIRYWFYRLEYYLWSDREQSKFKAEEFGENKTKFLSVANNFYFRNLNSIEHFRAKKNEGDNENWLGNESELDNFGNLALISGGFNSELNAQIIKKKEIDIVNQKNTESLKLVLMCCAMRSKQADNSKSKAKQHEEEMLDILKESLALRVNVSRDSNNSKETK